MKKAVFLASLVVTSLSVLGMNVPNPNDQGGNLRSNRVRTFQQINGENRQQVEVRVLAPNVQNIQKENAKANIQRKEDNQSKSNYTNNIGQRIITEEFNGVIFTV